MPLPLGVVSGGKHLFNMLGGVEMAEITYWQCEKCGVTLKPDGCFVKMGGVTMQLTGYSINKFERTAGCICDKCQKEYREIAINTFKDFFNK